MFALNNMTYLLMQSKNNQHMENLEVSFKNVLEETKSSIPETEEDTENASQLRSLQPPNTCRILQRKLELKVERAKRNYSNYQKEQVGVK